MRLLFHIGLLFTFLMLAPGITAQTDEATAQSESFNEATWQELVDDAEYFRNKKKKKKEPGEVKEEEESKPVKTRTMPELSIGALKYVLLAAVIGILAYVLLRVFAKELFIGPNKLDPAFSISMDDLDDHIEDAPMQRFLKECLQAGDYSSAIRVYYLMILQQLNSSGLIAWHKEKTNSHYLREMRSHRKFDLFRSLTSIFETVWYSEHDAISLTEFEEVEPSFKEMLAILK